MTSEEVPEREAAIRAAVELTKYDRREPGDSPGEQIRYLLAALDDERARANRCERERDELAAKLAELREAATGAARFWTDAPAPISHDGMNNVVQVLFDALAATAPTAEAYTQRVQAEVVAERDAALRLVEAYGIVGREERGPSVGDAFVRLDGGTMTVVDIKRGSWRMPVFESEKGTTHQRALHPAWVLRGGR